MKEHTWNMRVNTTLSSCAIALLLLLSASASSSIRVVDSQGRLVRLEAPAQRIVALAPHIVENVFSAGAGHLLVGTVSYADYPPGAQKIPAIGDHQSWSLESIIALQPDLILMWGSGSGANAHASLQRLGLPIYISEPRQFADISNTIRNIGTLAGTQNISEPEAQRIERKFVELAAQYSTHKNLSVLYQIWDQPLQTLNGDHLISKVIELCGGRNLFFDAASIAPKISLESVLHRNPDVIVASGTGASRPAWLAKWMQYPSLTAVKNNTLFTVNPDHIQRPTARILIGAKTLCTQLESAR